MLDNDEFFWETRQKAIEALEDVLPTKDEFDKHTQWYSQKPDERLLADETQVYAFLPSKNEYGQDSLIPHLIAERAFLASCSSSWGWGLRRYPNCPVSYMDIKNIVPSGACDPFEEWTHAELRDGILRTKKRIETGIPQSAGIFGIVVIDLYAAYGDGWQITDEFFRRLKVFREHTWSHRFNQRGYQVVSRVDDHVVLILPPEPHQYDKYLLASLKELNKAVGGITLGVSVSNLYFWRPKEIFSEAVNRLWLQMRNLPCGGVVLDGIDGAKVAGRIGLGTSL